MSDMTSPSEVLNAAADRVRDLAAQASDGVWKASDLAEHGHEGVWWVEQVGPVMFGCIAELANAGAARDAAWIAALSPAVAPHLESILRAAAKTVDEAMAGGWSEAEVVADADDAMKAAFGLARVLVPEVSP